jgi:acyl-CoA synthetase (AMP-forming)/AMP-acid ligase II
MEFYRTPFLDTLSALPPSTVIFTEGTKKTLAGTLYQRSLALAVGLRREGFRPKDRIGVIVPPGSDFLEVIFATTMLDGMIALIDPEMGRDNFESKLRQFDPQWLFVDSRLLLLREYAFARKLYQRIGSRGFYCSFGEVEHVIASGSSLPPWGKYLRQHKLYCNTEEEITFVESGDREFMITYTSGTLAEPKGVVHTVNSLYESLMKIRDVVSTIPEVRIAAYLPAFLLLGICSGNPVLLFDRNKDAAWLERFVKRNGITTLFGPPSFYMPLIQHCRNRRRLLPASIQLMILGSAPVHPRFLQSLYDVVNDHTKVRCLYGMTENLVIATIDGREKIRATYAGDVVGTLVDDADVSIADDGEILIQSPQLFSRYLHLAQREMPHHTGDLGYIADGNLVLTGRKKDMIIRRDTNIYPAIYERTIKNIPGVAEAVLIGVYSEAKHDEEVFLVVESDHYTESELMMLLRTGEFSIDQEALPDKIVFRTIPTSGRQNKVDRKQLRLQLNA